jgi:hypothetical protein
MKYIALIFYLIASISNCFCQNLTFQDSIINLAQSKILSYSQLNYNCRFFSKNIGAVDTTILTLNVKIKKDTDGYASTYYKVITTFDPKRPTYEFKTVFDNNFGYYYSLDKLNKNGTFRKFYGEGKSVLGYFHSGVRFFIDSTITHNFRSKISLSEYIGIDSFQNFKVYKFEIRTADMSPVKNYKTVFYFNVTDLMLIRVLNTYEVNSESVYIDYQIISYDFKNETIHSFFQPPDIDNYSITFDTLESKENVYPLLKHQVNDIIGTDINTLKNETITFKGKISVVNFWFMGCYGCILSYPVMDSLFRHYSKNQNIQFIGLNPFDSDMRLVERRKKYLLDHKISYRNYLIDKKTFDFFKERAMPLFLIIDENGLIRYQSVGYNLELYGDLDIQIKNLLNK